MDTAVLILDIIFVGIILGGTLLDIAERRGVANKKMTWVEVRQRNSHIALGKGMTLGAAAAIFAVNGVVRHTSQTVWLLVAVVACIIGGFTVYVLIARYLDRKSRRD